LYHKKLLLLFVFFWMFATISTAQNAAARAPIPTPDTIIAPLNFTYSRDTLDAEVNYTASDSVIMDVVTKKIYLYGKAVVKYTTITIKADYIVLDNSTNIATAEGVTDTLGRTSGKPEFEDGSQKFTANKMLYNFVTKKGIVYEVRTKQNDLFVLTNKAKFVANTTQDTTKDTFIYGKDAIFTSCSDAHPHFGVRSSKQKIIPNKLIIVGPSNIEIGGVPTPLWLPFGFFPVPKKQQTGLLFPKDYEFSRTWGFGLKNIGYYIPVNQYMDLALLGDIYFNGTFGVRAETNFNRRYKFNGNGALEYSRRISEIEGTNKDQIDNSFAIRFALNQDGKAHPTRTFGGSVNIQTNGFQKLNRNDAKSVLQNTLSSNLSFNKIFPNTPFTFSANLTHSQNTQTRDMTISFPNFDIQMQTVYPFKRKVQIGSPRWYENVSLQYNSAFQNQFMAKDTALFQRETLANARYGMRHRAAMGTNFRVLKYFNVTPNINFGETWYGKSIEKTYSTKPVLQDVTETLANGVKKTVRQDTVSRGSNITNTLLGFNAIHTFDASISANTQIFGTLLFKKGWLRGVRHTMKPSVGLAFTPDYVPKYYKTVQDPSDPRKFNRYSRFEEVDIFGSPSSSGKQLGANYSISHILALKYFSKKDSITKNITLLDNIYMGGFYNAAADSLRWSAMNISGSTSFFKGITSVQVNASYDPYVLSKTGGRINSLALNNGGGLLRFDNASMTIYSVLTVGKIREILTGKPKEQSNSQKNSININNNSENTQNSIAPSRIKETDFLSLFENFGINHNMSFSLTRQKTGRDTFIINTNSLSTRGSIKITNKWSLQVGNIGYDFQAKSLTYPDIGFYRDLHCWEAGGSWQPTRGTYSFFIRVKPASTFNFINLPYNKNNVDGLRGF
jgi:LptD protein